LTLKIGFTSQHWGIDTSRLHRGGGGVDNTATISPQISHIQHQREEKNEIKTKSMEIKTHMPTIQRPLLDEFGLGAAEGGRNYS